MILKDVANSQMDRPKEARTVKRGDGFTADLDELYFEEGFNPRDLTTPGVKAHIVQMYEAYKTGTTRFPPITVSVADDGRLIVRDGHCRVTMYRMAREDGMAVPLLQLEEYRGNAKDFMMLALARSNGRRLTPLEIATGFKKLAMMGMSEEEIANARVADVKSVTRVKQLLTLAYAPEELQKLVRDEVIKADPVINLIQRLKSAEQAYQHLLERLKVAKAQGKSSLTEADLHGRAIPKKLVTGLVGSVSTFADRLGNATRRELATLEKLDAQQLKGKTVTVDAAALLDLLKHNEQIAENRRRQAERTELAEKASKQTEMEV